MNKITQQPSTVGGYLLKKEINYVGFQCVSLHQTFSSVCDGHVCSCHLRLGTTPFEVTPVEVRDSGLEQQSCTAACVLLLVSQQVTSGNHVPVRATYEVTQSVFLAQCIGSNSTVILGSLQLFLQSKSLQRNYWKTNRQSIHLGNDGVGSAADQEHSLTSEFLLYDLSDFFVFVHLPLKKKMSVGNQLLAVLWECNCRRISGRL